MKRWIPAAMLVTIAALMLSVAAAQQPTAQATKLSAYEVERFLREGKIGARRAISVGVNGTEWAPMDDGKIQHRGHIATIDVSKASFTTDRGTEINFKDSWKFYVAAYELAKMLDFPLVPPSVERKVGRMDAAVTWWIDDAMMEGDRKDKKLQSPDLEGWNNQMYAVRVFNQLIYNVDANLTNILITKDWNIWMIDHGRAFRMMKTLENPKNLVKSDRKVLAKMRELTKPLLTEKLGRWLTGLEIDGLLARRDRIVQFFDNEIAAKGAAAVLFDLAPRHY
ncbi:MAG: hypothetical protein HY646_17905 [Acidobacteria bacterium]|nr:hypothetical protein [Acidobacteriota bacterium]